MTFKEVASAENKALIRWAFGTLIGEVGIFTAILLAPGWALLLIPGYLIFISGSDVNEQAKALFKKQQE